jgi:hypothetical protein
MSESELLELIIKIFEENQIEYILTGSLVSSIQGEPRATNNIDFVIQIKSSQINLFLNTFKSPDYYLDEGSIINAIENESMFQILHLKSGIIIDLWLITNDPFDIARFSGKIKENILGTQMYISRPEDTILSRLRWCKKSGFSEKQFNDALRVYEVQYNLFNMDYLHTWAKDMKILDLLEKIESKSYELF